jgi:hypothetical protein
VWLPVNILQSAFDAISEALVEADLAAKIPEGKVGGEPV